MSIVDRHFLTSLVHLDAVHNHRMVFGRSPSRQPVVPGVPEVEHGGLRVIDPGLVTCTIGEPTVRTTDGNVQNQVKAAIERCRVGTVYPWVLEDGLLTSGIVCDDGREVSAIEEGHIKREVEGTMEARIDVDPHEIRRPLDGVLVEPFIKRLTTFEPPSVRLRDGVDKDSWTPVE